MRESLRKKKGIKLVNLEMKEEEYKVFKKHLQDEGRTVSGMLRTYIKNYIKMKNIEESKKSLEYQEKQLKNDEYQQEKKQ